MRNNLFVSHFIFTLPYLLVVDHVTGKRNIKNGLLAEAKKFKLRLILLSTRSIHITRLRR